MDQSIENFDGIFRSIKSAHTEKIDVNAQRKFIEMHDELSDRKQNIIDDEDRRGILSKSKGQLARLAMVIHSIEEAITSSEDRYWSPTIKECSLQKAKTVMDYIIKQKFALMPPEVKITESDSLPNINIDSGTPILDNNPKYLSKFLSYKSTEVAPSDVSRFRLMPPTPTQSKNKYPVEECRSFMWSISQAGFGSIDESRKDRSSKKPSFS